MKINFKNRKLLFSSLIILICILIILFYFWRSYKEWKIENYYGWEDKYSEGRNYVINKTQNGNIVENKKEKFLMIIPLEWDIKIIADEITEVASHSPDFDENKPIESLKKGACGFGMAIYTGRKINSELLTTAEILKNEINRISANNYPENSDADRKKEVVSISGKSGLKTIFAKNEEIRSIQIEIPVEYTVYIFTSGIIFNQECVDEFNKIIERVIINKT